MRRPKKQMQLGNSELVSEDALVIHVLDTMLTAYNQNKFTSMLDTIKQIWRFSMMACNKATQLRFLGKTSLIEDAVGALSLKGRHPLEALTQSTGCMWERSALQRYITTQYMQQFQVITETLLHERRSFAKSVYGHKMKSTMVEAQKLSPLCTSYTYQFVRRIKVTPSTSRPSLVVVNGEALKRVFISMPDVKSSLEFVKDWLTSQKNASSEDATCMLECGTHDQTLRKWVLDVDASIADLSSGGLVADSISGPSEKEIEFMQSATLEMASGISQWMYEMDFLHEACSFAVTSRHSKVKMSWHITLHALGCHELWRSCMFQLDEYVASTKKTKWIMYKYVDGSTKRNSKSQYMQIIGSTKVKPGCDHDGNFFKREGLFDCDGQPMLQSSTLSDEMFYAATSMVIHDPWSLPFKCQKFVPNEKKRKTQVSISRAQETIATKCLKGDCGGLTSWENVPLEQQKWMRHFIDGSAAADLKCIPTMTQAKNWCDDVMRLVNTGRGTLLLYAYVNNAAACPRFLKIKIVFTVISTTIACSCALRKRIHLAGQ
jgi:hypothetical protein